MSKIGEKVIPVPTATQVRIDGRTVHVKGSKGEITMTVPEILSLQQDGQNLTVKRKGADKQSKAFHGLYRSIIANAVAGVETAWQKRLDVVGTGYNVKLQGQDLVFKVGYSHPIVFKYVPGLTYQVEGNNKVIVSGADKQLVGQIAFQIKLLKLPDAYKGKGIRYEGEKVRIKPGKKAKTA